MTIPPSRSVPKQFESPHSHPPRQAGALSQPSSLSSHVISLIDSDAIPKSHNPYHPISSPSYCKYPFSLEKVFCRTIEKFGLHQNLDETKIACWNVENISVTSKAMKDQELYACQPLMGNSRWDLLCQNLLDEVLSNKKGSVVDVYANVWEDILKTKDPLPREEMVWASLTLASRLLGLFADLHMGRYTQISSPEERNQAEKIVVDMSRNILAKRYLLDESLDPHLVQFFCGRYIRVLSALSIEHVQKTEELQARESIELFWNLAKNMSMKSGVRMHRETVINYIRTLQDVKKARGCLEEYRDSIQKEPDFMLGDPQYIDQLWHDLDFVQKQLDRYMQQSKSRELVGVFKSIFNVKGRR